jgi:hypothetical protein
MQTSPLAPIVVMTELAMVVPAWKLMVEASGRVVPQA